MTTAQHQTQPQTQPATDAPQAQPSARPATAPSRRVLIAWMLGVTRPVLAPVVGSAACRVADLLAGVALFALGAHAVVTLAQDLAAGASADVPWALLALMALLCLAKAALRYWEQLLGHLVAFKALELLRAEIFQALIPRAPRVSATACSGDLLVRATKDVDRIEVFFAHTFAPVLSAVLVPSAVLVAVGFTTSWQVAGAALVPLLLALLVAPVAGWRGALRSSRETVQARGEIAVHVTDTVQGMSEVVGYGRAAERLEETARLDDAVESAFRPASLSAAGRRGAVATLLLLAPLAMVSVGGPEVLRGGTGLAALAASVCAVARLGECVRAVEESASSLNSSFASAERVYEVVHAPVELPDGALDLAPVSVSGCAGAPAVEWDEVSYTYPGASVPAVEHVSAAAAAGQWTCLVGASGSGKTTIAQLVARVDDPTAGTVRVAGTDARDLARDALYSEVALVPQRSHLLRASIADNVRLAVPEADAAAVETACRVACLHEDVLVLDAGYDTPVGERGAALSGGQSQRLALARALLAEPSVLVLDEFTSHLDPVLDDRVHASVRRWARERGATVIEVTHRLRSVPQADRVVVLDSGAVVQAGDPQVLLAVDGPLRRLVGRETAA